MSLSLEPPGWARKGDPDPVILLVGLEEEVFQSRTIAFELQPGSRLPAVFSFDGVGCTAGLSPAPGIERR